MKYTPIAVTEIPAIANVSGWIRTAKVVYISKETPVWMVRIINELVGGR